MGRALPLYDREHVLESASQVERTSPGSVRVSLTDRCDLACVYCRPGRDDGYFESRLDLASWMTILEGLVASGVRRVRITGGEPLLHKDVVAFVAKVRALAIDDLALTTNATRLERLAKPLREAGLERITISLDSLDEARFRRLTRGGELANVLAGIEAAVSAGFAEVKINVVVVRGENEDELEALTRFAWARGITPRFLEIMPIGEGRALASKLVTGTEIRARLGHLVAAGTALPDPNRGPAKYLCANDGSGRRIGFITGTSDTFCKGCDRLRVASDGTLRPCLATNDGTSARLAAARGDVAAVRKALDDAWAQKPDGETWRGCTESTAAEVSIRSIGG